VKAHHSTHGRCPGPLPPYGIMALGPCLCLVR
jgi:hypothetical protein